MFLDQSRFDLLAEAAQRDYNTQRDHHRADLEARRRRAADAIAISNQAARRRRAREAHVDRELAALPAASSDEEVVIASDLSGAVLLGTILVL